MRLPLLALLIGLAVLPAHAQTDSTNLAAAAADLADTTRATPRLFVHTSASALLGSALGRTLQVAHLGLWGAEIGVGAEWASQHRTELALGIRDADTYLGIYTLRNRRQYHVHAKHWFTGWGKNDWSVAPYVGAHARYVTDQYQVRVPGRIYEDLEATYTGQPFFSGGLSGGVGLWGFFNDHWFMTAQANLLYLPLLGRPSPLEALPGVGLYLIGFAPSLYITVGYRF